VNEGTPAPAEPPSWRKRSDRGLKSVNRLQGERRADRVGLRFLKPKVMFAVIAMTAAVFFTNMFFANRDLERRKNAILDRQAAVRSSLGSYYGTLVSKVAKWIPGEAGAYRGDTSERVDFATGTFAYVRLHMTDAQSVAAVQTGAREAQRDALASCFASGEPKEPGEPLIWPIGGLFRKTEALQAPFVEEVRETITAKRIEFLEWRFKEAEAAQLAEAKRMFGRLQYVLVALDEESGAGKTELSLLQLEEHPVRVAVLRLADDHVLFRRKLTMMPSAAGVATASLEVLHAMRRNASNCDVGRAARAAALAVK
jgi:hypothetical protein